MNGIEFLSRLFKVFDRLVMAVHVGTWKNLNIMDFEISHFPEFFSMTWSNTENACLPINFIRDMKEKKLIWTSLLYQQGLLISSIKFVPSKNRNPGKMFSILNTQIPGKDFIRVASLAAASAMLIVPSIYRIQKYFFSSLTEEQTRVIEDDQEWGSLNEEFRAADIYLSTIMASSFQRLRVMKDREMKKLASSLDINEEIVDVFENVQVKWRLKFRYVEATEYRSEHYIRCYELSFQKKYQETVVNSYLPYISEKSKAIRGECKAITLYQVGSEYTVDFDHPMTFENIAMDSEIKAMVLNDLKTFRNIGKECYRSNGKAWRRGYFLFGPPGTGKSSLIAAMANHLKYDIYDFSLSLLEKNPEFFFDSMVSNSSSESMLVFEDIDSIIKQQNSESEDQPGNSGHYLETLLTLLNDSWSCCGDGQIIVLTTSHMEMLEPGILKPGLIDLQIHMSYCSISAFNQLAFNHFGIQNHRLFEDIERLLQKVEITLAEVAAELMKSRDAEVALQGLVRFLHNKLAEKENLQN